jgi:hypothetical protein
MVTACLKNKIKIKRAVGVAQMLPSTPRSWVQSPAPPKNFDISYKYAENVMLPLFIDAMSA